MIADNKRCTERVYRNRMGMGRCTRAAVAHGKCKAHGEKLEAPTQTWFAVRYYGDPEPEPVAVIRVTEETLVTQRGREAITSSHKRHFPTREEAVAHILSRAKAEVEDCRGRLSSAERELDRLRKRFGSPS